MLVKLTRVILALGCLLAVPLHAFADQPDQSYDPSKTRVHTPFNTAWTGYQARVDHNAVFPDSDLSVKWHVLLGGKINGGLSVVDGIVYATSFDQNVYALNLKDGYTIWRTSLPNITMSTPVVQDGIVVVGTGTNMLLTQVGKYSAIWGVPQGDAIYALSAKDGHLVWRFKTVGEDMPSAAIYHNLVIFVNGDRHAYALDLHTGHLRWKVLVHGNAAMSNAQIHNGVVFTTECETSIHAPCETRALDARTGKTLWINHHGSQEATPTIGEGLVFISQIVPNPRFYEPGGATEVVAINERTGKTVWTKMGPTGPCPGIGTNVRQISATLADGILFQPFGCQTRFYAMEPHTGRVLWSYGAMSGPVKMSPIVFQHRVYFGDTEGILYSLHERTGRLVRAISLDEPFSCSPPVIVGRTLLIANAENIYAMPVPIVQHTHPEDAVVYRSKDDVPMHVNVVRDSVTPSKGVRQ